jgi:transcriptional repressor NrdR
VLKKNGDKRTFDAQKLKKSINMAVRKRPVENSQVEQIVYQITHQIAINNELEIASAKIGEMVLEALEKLDQVAFVRFASVYKNFKTPQDFQQFIKKIV